MHIGFITDGLGNMPLPQALDVTRDLGIKEIEIATGNWSQSPHIELSEQLSNSSARAELVNLLATRNLKLGALNCSGNIMHPENGRQQEEVVRNTMRLASELGIDKIVMMSGLPPVNDTDKVSPWIVTCWPAENVSNLETQWSKGLEKWGSLVEFAKTQGIKKIALEMHANQLVWNPPTLLRMRKEIGSIIGANMDPSHLMWMGAEPIACVRELKDTIYHVHAKDTRIEKLAETRTRLEPRFFDRIQERAWNYVTLGEGWPGGVDFWRQFCNALQESGYNGVLSIEHEDVAYSPIEGLSKATHLLQEVLQQKGE